MESRRKLQEEDLIRILQDSDVEYSSGDESDNGDVHSPSPEAEEQGVGSYVEDSIDGPASTSATPRGNPKKFTWIPETEGNPWVPLAHRFVDTYSGPVCEFARDASPAVFFKHFLNQNIVSHIVQETNKYFVFFTQKAPLKPHSRLQDWNDVTAEELYVFLAVTMLMTRNKHLTIEEHWSSDPLLKSNIFSATMSRNRYTTILSMLHFNDSSIQSRDDKLYKIRPILDHTRQIFGTSIVPYKNLCIDESVVVFKGRLSFKQYLPNKRHRFGIKLFVLCDVKTGFILDIIVYCGTGTDILPNDVNNLGVSGAVVNTLMEKYLNKCHTLFVDNWYTSPKLFLHLHNLATNASGTVNIRRIGMPTFKLKLKKGETDVRHCGPLMALKWEDKKSIHMLSTCSTSMITPSDKLNFRTGLPKMKPQCVLDYNKSMGSVDKADMMLSSLGCIRKTMKWYRKLFFCVYLIYTC